MGAIYQVPTTNNAQYLLDATYSSGGHSLTLNSNVNGIIQAPGICVIDRVDSSGTKTPTRRTYYSFTGVSSTQLTGVTTVDGTDQDHGVGAVVEFVPDIVWAQSLYDALSQVIDTTSGLIDLTKVVAPTETQTLTNKTLTSPTITNPTVSTGTFTTPALTTPVISGTPGTTAGKVGFDDTNNDILVGDGAVQQKIHIGAAISYTPTVSSSSGTITTKSATGTYILLGRMCFVSIIVTITTNGTGAGAVTATLPFTSATSTGRAVLNGRADSVSGKQLQGIINASGTVTTIQNYDGTYPGASGETLVMSGAYEI